MKNFLKNLDGPQSSLYEPAVKVKFVSGKKPELVIFESDSDTDHTSGKREVERIPISNFSNQELHALMEEKGFPKKDFTLDCVDHEDGSTTCKTKILGNAKEDSEL